MKKAHCSADFARVCARWKVRQSMGRVGSCFDNAVAGATFSTVKVEYVHVTSSAPVRKPG